uniref:Retrotransposon gag domain-containing protein n=2 Tax=Cajanus cajan TaxID=3821 RepID=A0A151T2D3_CAJCA|nr:hypothetical protein KK1_023583 [Cajanus cajan]KYP68329.1 hypothetical protein KK1_021950 [Cajanus cajan]
MISFYMKGDALSWFKWMHFNHQLQDWESFTRSLELRFGPSSYENHQQMLFKLRQKGSVIDYQVEFERISNRVYGLSPDSILHCFISGLLPEIQEELALHRPQSINQAIDLAKLVESKLSASKARTSTRIVPHKPYSSLPPPKPSLPAPPSSPVPSTTTSPTLPVKRLTQAQLQERRALGLCYNCDEKFHPTHRCKPKQFLLLLTEDADPHSTPPIFDPSPPSSPTHIDSTLLSLQLSPQALIGSPSPKTLRFLGSIAGITITILVDTGSSHNILQPRLANHLNLSIHPISPFQVMVGNGDTIPCTGFCPNVDLTIQSHKFIIPCYLLPIAGADLVLGIAWLQTLGSIVSDFSVPCMTFTHDHTLITLLGSTNLPPHSASYPQILQFLHNDAITSLHLLTFTQIPSPDPEPTNLPNFISHLSPDFQNIILQYSSVFHTPHGLPPVRSHDHHITLLHCF